MLNKTKLWKGKEGSRSLTAVNHVATVLSLPHFLSARCEVNQGDALEQASPVTDVVVERNEDFYDQSYVNEKENTATEVSFIMATTFQQSSSSLCF